MSKQTRPQANGKDKSGQSMLSPEELHLLEPILKQAGVYVEIPASQLNVDWSYQKRPRERICNQIVAQLYEALLGVLMVAQRPDNTHWVFDGVTRLEGVNRRGEKQRVLRSLVFQSTGQKQEALLFALWNSRRCKEFIRKEHALHAYGIAGVDKGFSEAVEQCGYSLIGGGLTQLRGPGYVKAAWDIDPDPKGVMVRTLFATKQEWKDRYRVYGYMVLGIARLFKSQRRPVDDQVRRVLHRMTPDEILEKVSVRYTKAGGKKARPHPGDMPALIGRAIADEINKNPGKSGRIDLDRLKDMDRS